MLRKISLDTSLSFEILREKENNRNIKSIKNNLIKRKIINYFRNILVSLKTFLKSIINK